MKIKCKKCPYYSGIQCHGQGDYWGICLMLEQLRQILANSHNISKYDLHRIGAGCWDNILYDESQCMFITHEPIKKNKLQNEIKTDTTKE